MDKQNPKTRRWHNRVTEELDDRVTNILNYYGRSRSSVLDEVMSKWCDEEEFMIMNDLSNENPEENDYDDEDDWLD